MLQRRSELEEKVERIGQACEVAARIVRKFEELDREEADLLSLEADVAANRENMAKLTSNAKTLLANVNELTKEMDSVVRASGLARMLKRSSTAIESDLQAAHKALGETKGNLASLIASEQTAVSRLTGARDSVSSLRSALRFYNRRVHERELEEAEAKKAPLTVELAEIAKQLDDIAKSVTERAMVIGATATKLFLTPQTFDGFDTVIIDEASMLLLPSLFHAAGLAKERVVVSGDFRQLPPIVPTDQKAILKAIGGNVFSASGITKAFGSKSKPERATFLDKQYRMADPICSLLSGRIYDGRLHTAREGKTGVLPAPFDGPLTIVDTSTVSPFVNRDPFGSRYNLMHVIAARNLVRRLCDSGFVKELATLGLCTPYSAQAKLLKRVLRESNLEERIAAGTVHRYQGDEKQAMLLDIPDGLGEPTVGFWLEADNPEDDGAKLFNVAISRAKDHLIVFANLGYLDLKLPSRAFLRGVLHDMQRNGIVVDVRDVLGYYPMMDDIRRYGLAVDLDPETIRTGLFNQKDFNHVWVADAHRAQRSIVIFSGFVTPQRVAMIGDVLRKKAEEGVAIRCVTRPPQHNGSIPPEDGKAALDALERIGCLIDTRWDIHEKTIIIDGEIIWFGSLNPLSHGGTTSEIMGRFVGRAVASQIAAFLAVEQGVKAEEAADHVIRKENPACDGCGRRTTYRKGRYGPFWECEEGCGWRQNLVQAKRRAWQSPPANDPGPCPGCGKPMVVRNGAFGAFFGCSDYPRCDATAAPEDRGR